MEVYELDHSKSPKIGPAKKIPFFLKKDLLFLKRCHIIVKAIRSKGVFQKRVNCEQLHNAELCNGSTADSDSVCEGSNPSSAAIEVWLSLVERYVRDVEAGGSNPLTSTILRNNL